MRLLSRSDSVLVIGLLASTVILFRQPLRSLLDLAYEIESLYQLDLVPALAVLCTVLLFHQSSKHHQTTLEAERVIAKAEQTQARMSEVTRLLTLAQALTNVVEKSALEAVLRQQFPRFVDQPLANLRLQSFGQAPQQLITGNMATRVIYDLELVEVQIA